jgi:hypothetical protein
MTGSRFIALTAASVALAFAGTVQAAPSAIPVEAASDVVLAADQSAEQPAETGDAEDHSPKSPIRVSTIDYQEAGENAGTLKLAGKAVPGTPLYLFFDDAPLAKLDADDAGNWSLERELDLGGGRHVLRAEQYDPTTRMLAGRATVTIERAPEGSAGEAPAKTPAPGATTP